MILQMGWANLPRDERLAKNVRCISRTETKERQSMGGFAPHVVKD